MRLNIRYFPDRSPFKMNGAASVRTDDPNVVFAGSFGGQITRFDYRTR
ncbi:MAG: hypothetical protein WD535_05910 [Thermaerobacterales bacterium]